MKTHCVPRREPRPALVQRFLMKTLQPVRSLLVVALAILFIGSSAAAVAQTASIFGNDASSGTASNPLSANFKRASRFTLNERATLVALSVYLQGTNAGGSNPVHQSLQLAIYKDAGGVPGSLVGESEASGFLSNIPAQWWNLNMVGEVVLEPGSYWIAILTGSTAGAVVDFSNDTSPNWYGDAENVDGEKGGVPSSQFGSGSAGIGTLLVKGYYLPDSIESQFGRTDPAAAPSSGLSADFKRGSQFTLSERATLDTLNAYLDGNGGASGFQQVSMALYRDAGGVPGALVAESDSLAIGAGSPASWYTFHPASAPLDPGVYWIVLLSGGGGGPSGVVRDYGDGQPDWYGNANTFTAGPSNPFGSGTAGSGTLSMYAAYLHGVTTAQFGQTAIGNTPSAGLTANFIRGSSGGDATTVRGSTTPTGFYAYLDGNGGASGSQQVRVALYRVDPFSGKPTDKLAESSVVTIQAGMPAQWVYFPLLQPYPLLFSPVWITLQSGGVGGVVRDYGITNDGFWVGASAPFQSQAPATFPASTPAIATSLSIYTDFVAGRSLILPP